MADVKVANAFVEDVVSDRDGVVFALRTSEPHRRKNDQGEWETTARTFRTVRASRDSGVDLSVFRKGDRVEFQGSEKTEKRERDGRTFYDLIVWVASIAALGGSGGRSQAPAPDEPWGAGSSAQAGVWASQEPMGGYGDDTAGAELPF